MQKEKRTLNKELLMKVRDAILAEPNLFDMSGWKFLRDCGTTCCIAGHAVRLADPEAFERLCSQDSLKWSNKGKEVLGLSNDRCWILFHSSRWPEQWADKYFAVQENSDLRAMVAGQFLDAVIASDGAILDEV